MLATRCAQLQHDLKNEAASVMIGGLNCLINMEAGKGFIWTAALVALGFKPRFALQMLPVCLDWGNVIASAETHQQPLPLGIASVDVR